MEPSVATRAVEGFRADCGFVGIALSLQAVRNAKVGTTMTDHRARLVRVRMAFLDSK
jgi:hypothetical protein